MQNLFIVLEGIDGSGTSTQAELLKNHFIAKQEKAVVSPEPSTGKIGKLLRELLSGENIFASQEKLDEQIAYLFAADRHYHLYNKIDGVYKLISQNIHVISTRYYFSSLAYNSKNQDDFEFVWGLNRHFPPPDLVIYLEIPVELALGRMKQRQCKEIYENEAKLINVKTNFDRIFSNYHGKLLRVDGTQSKPTVHESIVQYLSQIMANNGGS